MNTNIFTTKRALALLACTTLVIGGIALAHGDDDEQRGEQRGEQRADQRAERIVQRLDSQLKLDDNQRAQVTRIVQAGIASLQARRAAAVQAVTAAVTADELRPEDATALIESLRDSFRDSYGTDLASVVAELHAVLTPTQRERAAALITDFASRGGNGLITNFAGHGGNGQGHGCRRGHHS